MTRVEQDVPIRLYRFKGQQRWRWAARLGAVEGYGALPSQALAALVEGLDSDDEAALLIAAKTQHHRALDEARIDPEGQEA